MTSLQPGYSGAQTCETAERGQKEWGKNKKELGHIGYKISAVLLAIVAWLAVANISDYQTTRQISNIPVTQINGDVLDELDQVYDVVSGDTVDIIVKGRRSVVGTLDKDDFTAIADLSTMFDYRYRIDICGGKKQQRFRVRSILPAWIIR